MIRFYDYHRAPSPRRARILLAEKAIPHEVIAVDLGVKEQLSDAFRAINPGLTVPVLVLEDGARLTDNAAILAWAEAAYPDPPLLGVTPLEKAEIASWHWQIENGGLMAIAEAMRNTAPGMKGRALPGPVDYEQIPELAERGLARLGHFLDNLETKLEGQEFVAGNRFSVADILAVVAIDFARVVRVQPSEQHSNIHRWRSSMAERPSMSL